MTTAHNGQVLTTAAEVYNTAKNYMEKGWWTRTSRLFATIPGTNHEFIEAFKSGIAAGVPAALAQWGHRGLDRVQKELPGLEKTFATALEKVVATTLFPEYGNGGGRLIIVDQGPDIGVYYDLARNMGSPADYMRRHLEIGHRDTELMATSMISRTAEAVAINAEDSKRFAGAPKALKELCEVVASWPYGREHVLPRMLERPKNEFPLPEIAHSIVRRAFLASQRRSPHSQADASLR